MPYDSNYIFLEKQQIIRWQIFKTVNPVKIPKVLYVITSDFGHEHGNKREKHLYGS
jgi:hypothetical protein